MKSKKTKLTANSSGLAIAFLHKKADTLLTHAEGLIYVHFYENLTVWDSARKDATHVSGILYAIECCIQGQVLTLTDEERTQHLTLRERLDSIEYALKNTVIVSPPKWGKTNDSGKSYFR